MQFELDGLQPSYNSPYNFPTTFPTNSLQLSYNPPYNPPYKLPYTTSLQNSKVPHTKNQQPASHQNTRNDTTHTTDTTDNAHGRPTIGRLAIHAGDTRAADVDFTGAGFFLIGEHGWLAGIGPTRYWQDFGGNRKPGETALQTATREMKEETDIVADELTTLHTHVTFKNEHVYVIHVARAPDGVAPRPSRELTQFKWMRDFANDFGTETKEAVHRRVLDDEFLTAVNAIHGKTSRGAPQPRDEQFTSTPHQH